MDVEDAQEFALAIISEVFHFSRQAELYNDLLDCISKDDDEINAGRMARIIAASVGNEHFLTELIRELWIEWQE